MFLSLHQGRLGACIQTFEPSLLAFQALGLTGWLGVVGKLKEKNLWTWGQGDSVGPRALLSSVSPATKKRSWVLGLCKVGSGCETGGASTLATWSPSQEIFEKNASWSRVTFSVLCTASGSLCA